MPDAEDQRRYPESPIVGVGVVVWKSDNVLLVKRGKPPLKNEWSLPGGGQHIGETIREAAHREVFEETAIQIKNLQLVEVVDAIFPTTDGQVEYHYTLIDFVAEWKNGQPIPGDDTIEARWFRREEIERLEIWSETKAIIDKSRQIIKT